MRLAILILIIALFAILTFKVCVFLDLQVSRKYETQWEGISNSPESKAAALLKKREIDESEKKLIIEVCFITMATIILIYLFSSRNSKINR